MSVQTQTAAEQVEQLNMLAASFIRRPTFKPGDLVMRRPETMPVGLRAKDVRQLAVVLETVDSLREFIGDKTVYPGQGLLICCTDSSGEIATLWVGSWQYQAAPADLIASFIGQTTH